jgi:cytochrome P450
VTAPTAPRTVPRVGHLPAFLRDKLGFLSQAAAQCGDVVRLELGTPTYLLSHPDDIRHVLLSKFDNYAKTPRIVGRRARRFFGDGVTTASGAEHLRLRRVLQPLFHRSVIERFADTIADITVRTIAGWSAERELDIRNEMLDLTQAIIVRALLARESDAERAKFARAIGIRRRYQEYLLGSVFPFPEWLPSRIGRAYRRASRQIDATVTTGVARRRAHDEEPRDLLALLVHARYEDGGGMPDRLIRDEVRTVSIGGYETLAEALSWTWYLLGSSPDVAARLAEEASAVGNGRPLGAADVPKLTYTRMVLAEAMRLYPPSWIFVRVAQEADVLASGVRVPAGAKIYVCPWVTHRDPRFFPDPARFDPMRFTEAAVRERPRLAYIPFGAGRRLCIGEELAWMEGVLVLAQVAAAARIEVVPGQAVVPEPNVTLRARPGIRVRVRLR